MRARPIRLAFTLALGLALAGCGNGTAVVTALRLQVSFDTALDIDQLRFEATAGGRALFTPSLRPTAPAAPLPSGTSVVVVLQDALAGQDVAVRVTGLRAGSAVAAGGVTATPILDDDRTIDVALTAAGVGDGGDTTPPIFTGAQSATAMGESTIALAWKAASDDSTSAAQIVYRVYQATAAGAESFATPTATSAPGETSLSLGGFHAGETAYFVVHAVDAAGNEDGNRKEVSATTPDLTPPVFAGVGAVTGTAATSILVTWQAGSDNVTPAGSLVYLVFVATSPGGETFATPGTISAPGATSVTVNGLIHATTYYVVVRARDLAGNVDSNTSEVSVKTR